MRKALDSVEMFFSYFVPSPLKRYYFLAASYFIFVFGGLIGWLILIGSEQFLLGFGIWKGIGYGIGLVLAILFTFAYHRHVTFGVKSETKERFAKFAPLQVFIAAANWLLFVAATHYFGFPDVQASFVITFVLSLVNFAANKLFIFIK
ncbi:GtrA family protein [Candidatus Woesearchaeota archaeon]|nr:GtrA family protein [Candidatus Woesearchaeota archaeon]